MNPLQFLSDQVANMRLTTENIIRSRSSSNENWEKVGESQSSSSPAMKSPQKSRYRSKSSDLDELIDVDEISSISSDSEKHSAWLLPEGTTAVPHALSTIRKKFQTNNLSSNDQIIRENALNRLCLPQWALTNSYPEQEQAAYEEKRRRQRESLTPKSKFGTNYDQSISKSNCSESQNESGISENITNNEQQKNDMHQNLESREKLGSNNLKIEQQIVDQLGNQTRLEDADQLSLPKNLSTISAVSNNSSSHASIELKPSISTVSSSKLQPTVGIKPRHKIRRSPLPSQQLAAQQQAKRSDQENITSTSSTNFTLNPANSRTKAASRGVSPIRNRSRTQSPISLNPSKSNTDSKTESTQLRPAIKKPAASRLPRPGMPRGKSNFGYRGPTTKK